jgi:4-hydroxy-tetrahydrodipicolinate synthase
MMKEIKGLYTALVTPFKNGKVDEKAFQSLVEWQIERGVHGLVPCGTTGESATLSFEEHKRVIRLCVEAAKGKVPIIAGTGANSTAEAIELTLAAKEAKADGVLLVAPYYNRPSQEGIFRHYKAIHDAVDIPMMLYNVPARCGVDISNDTITRLSELKNVIGIKDATGNLARISPLRASAGQQFIQLCGDDMTAVGFNAMGGSGCISVTANVAPANCAKVQQHCLEGNYKKALQTHDTLAELHEVMFCEASPGPVKYALSLMNKCTAEVRLPLTKPSNAAMRRIRDALLGAGVI